MNSLSATFVADFYKGMASGTTANPLLRSIVATANGLGITLSSTSTNGGKADTAGGIGKTRTLTAGTNETIDLSNFTDILSAASSATKVRFFFIIHAATSAASSITIGGAAQPFAPLGLSGTLTLLPGEFFVFGSPTTTGMTVSAGAHNVKVLNNDGANDASYEIGFLGEV